MAILLGWILLPILLALHSVRGQTTQWVDPLTNIPFQRYSDVVQNTTYSFIFPPTSPASNEFIGVITGPPRAGWIGASLGGQMRANLLIVAWTNGNTGLASPRYTAAYGPPPVVSGPVVTVLGTSGADSTQQRIVFRCQNCTSWSGGSINLNTASQPVGLASHNAIKPSNPGNSNSDITRHTFTGQFRLDTGNAHSNSYSTYLSQLQNAPPLGTVVTTTTTSTPITTTTTTISTTTPITTTTTTTPAGPQQTLFGQCGGVGWNGPTACVAGAVCQAVNQFYSQCVPR